MNSKIREAGEEKYLLFPDLFLCGAQAGQNAARQVFALFFIKNISVFCPKK